MVAILQTSCNKEKKESCGLTMAAIAGTYRITDMKYKVNSSSPEEDYYALLFPDMCERDDLKVLNNNYTYIFIDAGVKCSPSWESTGTWSVTGNILKFDYRIYVLPGPTTISGDFYNVESYDCHKLILSQLDVYTPGDKMTSILTRQ